MTSNKPRPKVCADSSERDKSKNIIVLLKIVFLIKIKRLFVLSILDDTNVINIMSLSKK